MKDCKCPYCTPACWIKVNGALDVERKTAGHSVTDVVKAY